MELRQLNTFIRAAQFQSFSKAAESLGYSQSAVTVQIRLLEEELGVRLFDRMGKRVSLTEQGRTFLERAMCIIQEVDRARLSLSGADETLRGQLHIGTLESLCYARLPGIIRRFRVRHPQVRIQITTGIPEELIAKMERGELDIIYILEEPLYSNSWEKALERQEEVVVASAGLGRTLGPGPHRLVELLDKPFYLTERDANYRRLLDRRLAAFDREVTPVLESSYASFLLRVLEETEGLSFLPRFLVEESVRRGKLMELKVSDLQAAMYGQIFYHREKWPTREMEAFIGFCREEEAALAGRA